ncbi:MAG TPA: transporter substrate-binding domain-containing protein [Micromonosporaceae bacterium]|nr:transporter substrate-binding domain-containing protein [Micromonosporaceae bacterium]
MRQLATEGTSRPSRRRTALTAVSATLMLVLVGAVACTQDAKPDETVESLRAGSPTLRDKTRWRIVVRHSLPLLGEQDKRTGEYKGFDIEIAKAVAAELGFDESKIDWVRFSTNDERLTLLQNGTADMTVATLSITDEREKLVDFAGPYLLVPQAVLLSKRRTKTLDTIADLRAKNVRVCALIGSTSAKALETKGIVPEHVNNHDKCMDGMRSGRYDAYSTDLTILLGFLSNKADFDTFEISDLAIADTVERIGIGLPNNDENLRKLVSYILERWRTGPKENSPWLRAYDRTIGPLLDLKYRSQPLVDNPPRLADYDSKVPRQ